MGLYGRLSMFIHCIYRIYMISCQIMNRRHIKWVKSALNVRHRPDYGALCAPRALLFKSKHDLLAAGVKQIAKHLSH